MGNIWHVLDALKATPDEGVKLVLAYILQYTHATS